MHVRRIVVTAAATLGLALLGPGLGNAWGGGGCHRAGTGVSETTGTTVSMVDACFTPTILHVAPGDSVTFVNRDPMVHNVTANDWGHWDDLYEGERFTTSFDAEGIYPFACTYHPGMTGAVVVGSGATSQTAIATAAPGGAAPPSDGRGWLVAGIAGATIGLACGYALARRRGRAPATAPVRA